MKIFLVGGAVRDTLLGLTPKDNDWVIVGANEDDITKLTEEGYTQVGSDFPVFLHPESGDEYALARVERKTGVGYHGFNVTADSSVTIEEDLARRDLTVNSMAMSDGGDIIDPYGGMNDLRNRVLRHTTDAFAEDPLRVLRLARFAARYHDWRVADETIELCKSIVQSGELNHLSVERVWAEMEKAFSETAPHRFFEVLMSTDAIQYCDTLKELFDPFSATDMALMRHLSNTSRLNRMIVGIGAIGKSLKNFKGPVRVKDCMRNVQAFLSSAQNAVHMHRVMKQSRAFQNGASFVDLIEVAFLYERAGFLDRIPYRAKSLLTAHHITCQIRAFNPEFAGLEGKALGNAIEAARVKAISLGVTFECNGR